MANHQNGRGGGHVDVMHVTDAAKIFHSFLLMNHPNGIKDREVKQFYAAQPTAGNHVKKRGLQKVIKEYPHLFVMEAGNNGNSFIRAKASAKILERMEDERMEKIAFKFYSEVLQGRSQLLKRCTDRTEFTKELYRWKAAQQ